MFTQLDDRFGGGHARQALIQYLNTDGTRLLHGRYSEDVGRALLSATAEATLLAAWMSYDSAPESALAQRYFIQALALAQAGERQASWPDILDAMSHQATYMGRFSEAANLAGRPGWDATDSDPTLTAHFHAMEARALARLGDAKGCDRALADAMREFERRKPEMTRSGFATSMRRNCPQSSAHCLRDLGRKRGCGPIREQQPCGSRRRFVHAQRLLRDVGPR